MKSCMTRNVHAACVAPPGRPVVRAGGGAPRARPQRPTSVTVQAGKQKVNQRGKVSSRPGPASPREARRQQQQQQQQEAPAQQLPTPAPTPPTAGASSAAAAATSRQPPPPPPPAASGSGAATAASAAAPASGGSSGGAASPFAGGGGGVGSTPQVVVDRMFGRMLACAGLPVGVGVLLFPLFYYMKVVQKLDFPFWVVYLASGVTFGGGLLGITYGVISTSWDPRREGSALGWTEFKANLAILLRKDA